MGNCSFFFVLTLQPADVAWCFLGFILKKVYMYFKFIFNSIFYFKPISYHPSVILGWKAVGNPVVPCFEGVSYLWFSFSFLVLQRIFWYLGRGQTFKQYSKVRVTLDLYRYFLFCSLFSYLYFVWHFNCRSLSVLIELSLLILSSLFWEVMVCSDPIVVNMKFGLLFVTCITLHFFNLNFICHLFSIIKSFCNSLELAFGFFSTLNSSDSFLFVTPVSWTL